MSAITDLALQAAPATKARGYWATVGRRITRDKVSMVCAFILALIFLSALCAPWLGLADPYQGSMIRRLRHIGTPNYPLGTDELGRDMLARLVYGEDCRSSSVPPRDLRLRDRQLAWPGRRLRRPSSTPRSCAP
jgi:peptide/nickel transport system permease protein